MDDFDKRFIHPIKWTFAHIGSGGKYEKIIFTRKELDCWLMALSQNWSNLTHYLFSSDMIFQNIFSSWRANTIVTANHTDYKTISVFWNCWEILLQKIIGIFSNLEYLCAQNWPLNIIGLQEQRAPTKYGCGIWNQLQTFQCQGPG